MPHSKGCFDVDASQFSAYRLMLRESSPNAIRLCGRLLRQYMCDQWAKAARRRLQYFRRNQGHPRGASYRQAQLPPQGSEKGADAGKRIIHPVTFKGGLTHLMDLYQDVVAAARAYGKRRLVITSRRNPSWPEIKESMLPNQTSRMRPDVEVRVFRIKIEALMGDIYAGGVFGRTVARL